MRTALLAPAFVFFGLFVGWPIGELFVLSLTKTDFLSSEFVGLRNFWKALHDAAFMRSVANSGLYILLLTIGSGLSTWAVAMLVMDLPKWWQDTVRFVFYIPMLSAGIIIGQIWKWTFHMQGPLNWLIGLFGIEPISFFNSRITAIPAIVLVVMMSSLGAQLIILLSAILGIDKELYDAAKIDGASSLQIKLRIVTPMVMPTIWLLALLSIIAAPQIFETVLALAPYEHTATMTFQIYRTAFQASRFGLASAEALILFALLAGVILAKQRITR